MNAAPEEAGAVVGRGSRSCLLRVQSMLFLLEEKGWRGGGCCRDTRLDPPEPPLGGGNKLSTDGVDLGVCVLA